MIGEKLGEPLKKNWILFPLQWLLPKLLQAPQLHSISIQKKFIINVYKKRKEKKNFLRICTNSGAKFAERLTKSSKKLNAAVMKGLFWKTLKKKKK